MNILLGANTFGNYHRQNIAVDSWIHLREKYGVKLCNIQFKDEENSFKSEYDILDIFSLKRSSKSDIKDNTKKLPYVNDIISSLYKEARRDNCDYFIFTNSDVIINSNLIRYIKGNKPKAFACSRLDIEEVESFQDILNKNVTPVRYEIAGFDTFVFHVDWYKKHSSLFRDYFLGKPVWDQVYATMLKIYGGNTPFGNGYPPYCFHIHHGISAVTTECPEQQFNIKNKEDSYLDKLTCKIFDTYLKEYLMHRTPWGSFIKPISNEDQSEQIFFNKFIV